MTRSKARQRLQLHSGQRDVSESDAHTRVVAHGRRWGGTTLAAHEAVEWARENDDAFCWCLSPMQRHAELVREAVSDIVPVAEMDSFTRHNLNFPNGSTIEFRSAQQGIIEDDRSPTHLVVDMASHIRKEDWDFASEWIDGDELEGRLFISTPNHAGQDWFHDLYQQGLMPGNDVESWHFTSFDNPWVVNDYVREWSDDLEKQIARQEVFAEFVGEV